MKIYHNINIRLLYEQSARLEDLIAQADDEGKIVLAGAAEIVSEILAGLESGYSAVCFIRKGSVSEFTMAPVNSRKPAKPKLRP